MADTERVYDRAEEKSVRDVVNEIVSIRDLLREENTIREKVRPLTRPVGPPSTPSFFCAAGTGSTTRPFVLQLLLLQLACLLLLVCLLMAAVAYGCLLQEDNTLLDTMLYAQQRLQAAIVRSFGADADRQSAGLLLGHETDPAAAGAGAGGGPYDATGDRAF